MKIFSFFLCFFVASVAFSQKSNPLRIGIAGLTHTHVHGIFNSARTENIEIVGIAEPNRELAERYAKQYGFSMDKVYPTLQAMLNATKPEAVTAFNSIAEHLETVQACAPLGIHVMVEKPLAVSLKDAVAMASLATKYHIFLLTNYETTWYPSLEHAALLVADTTRFGAMRKMVIHDGHQGPAEIGVNKEFLDWLTDPVKNGAGALMDFGCYGADISTWLMHGERPVSVTAVTQQIKPERYPKVDDEATIIVTYPKMQTVIQASWNWTFSRKDAELYGTKGYVMARDRNTISTRFRESNPDSTYKLENRQAPYDDPFDFFRAVVRKEITLTKFDLSSLEVNLVAMEILDAAIRSAKEKKTIYLQSK